VELIERSELPAESPGLRRRYVSLEDVLRCRDRRREAQYRALMETSVDDDGSEPEGTEAVMEELRRIRAVVAAERASQY
jgi:hypothetical protein